MNDRLRPRVDCAGIHTERKIYQTLLAILAKSASVLPRSKHMPQETRETRKNYIGILCEETDEPRMVGELRTANDRQMGRYLRSLVAAVFNRRIEAR
jgi:hypothetical protein